MNNEMPQAVIEITFGISLSFKPAVLMAIFVSVAKTVGIRLARNGIIEHIREKKSAYGLALFAKAHSIETALKEVIKNDVPTYIETNLAAKEFFTQYVVQVAELWRSNVTLVIFSGPEGAQTLHW